MHIFLDSSILLSFCHSKRGASALILDYCRAGKLKGFISKKVVYEVQNNNIKDENEIGKQRFAYVLNQEFIKIVEDPTKEELEKANKALNNPKDAPIIAAAKQVPAIQFVISLDKGFFESNVQEYLSPIEVLRPGDFINRFREKLGN